MKQKWTSRKWWLCIAIVLGGIASVISGLCTDNTTLTIIGGACSTLAAVIYQICETCIDVAAVDSNETVTVETELDEAETDDGGESVG